MARIIERGTIQVKIATLRCTKCNTLAEFEESDIKNDRDGHYVVCPLCGGFMSVEGVVWKPVPK